MSDLNKEALDVWGALKPMIDQEISSRTQGMVQRRKAKVTTAPSLATNTIGVTEAFGDEMFLPFVSNMISAKVGDFVWIEWMYGATNAFVSSFAAVDDKNITVAGTLDVVQRRCYATLSSTGWKRVMQVEWSADVESTGLDGLMTDFYIVRRGQTGYAEDHKITLVSHRVDSFAFVDETSYSGYQVIDKIRCTKVGKYNYVDIHYTGTSDDVSVHFYPYASSLARVQGITSMNLANVADAPSGETVVTTYSFNANGTGDVTVNGILDVVPRRSSATLSSPGWYRVLTYTGASDARALGGNGDIYDFSITRKRDDGNNEVHKITLLNPYNVFKFVDESSASNGHMVTKIRVTGNSTTYTKCVDIYYDRTRVNPVTVDFILHSNPDTQGDCVASGLTAVADSPSGETILTTYDLHANGDYTNTDLTVDGVLDVVPRRCRRELSGYGWRRAMDIQLGTSNAAEMAVGVVIDINIGSTYNGTNNIIRKITMSGLYYNTAFNNELSRSNNLNLIDKIRYIKDSSNNGHIDIHYNHSTQNDVFVTFDVHTFNDWSARFVASNLDSVADSPSGETVVKEYTFAANIAPTYLKRYVDSTAANYTIGSGGYVMVSYPSGLTGNKVVSIGIETWTSNSGPFLICPYGSTNTYWYIIGSSGTTINGVKFVYWYID